MVEIKYHLLEPYHRDDIVADLASCTRLMMARLSAHARVVCTVASVLPSLPYIFITAAIMSTRYAGRSIRVMHDGTHFALDVNYDSKTGETTRTWVYKKEKVLEIDCHLRAPKAKSSGEKVSLLFCSPPAPEPVLTIVSLPLPWYSIHTLHSTLPQYGIAHNSGDSHSESISTSYSFTP